jgi:hypothetical protein
MRKGTTTTRTIRRISWSIIGGDSRNNKYSRMLIKPQIIIETVTWSRILLKP